MTTVSVTYTLYRADTGDDGTALFHSTDAMVQLRVPVTGIPGNCSTVQVMIETDRSPRSLGYTNGMNAATALLGGRPGILPRPRRLAGYDDAQWAEYKTGWEEALDDYELDNG